MKYSRRSSDIRTPRLGCGDECVRIIRSLHDRAWDAYKLQPARASALTAKAQAIINRKDNEIDDANLVAENLALQAVSRRIAEMHGSIRSKIDFDAAQALTMTLADRAVAMLTPDAPLLLRGRVLYAKSSVCVDHFEHDRAAKVLRAILPLLPSEEEMSDAAASALSVEELQLPEVRLLVDTLNDIGTIHHRRGEFSHAVDVVSKAHRLVTGIAEHARKWGSAGYPRGEMVALNRLGNAYDRLGDHMAALSAYQECLRVCEIIGGRYDRSSILNNLADASKRLENFPQALDYYRQALDLSREIGFTSNEANVLGNMGMVMQQIGDVDTAIEYTEAALRMHRDLKNLRSEASVLNSLGNALQAKDRLAEAEDCYTQALQLNRQLADQYGIASSLVHLGRLLSQKREPTTGKLLHDETIYRAYLDEALKRAEQTESQELVIQVHEALAAAYKLRGDFAYALHHFEIYHAGTAALFKAQTIERARTLQLKHEREKSHREAEIHRLRNVELVAALREAQTQRGLAERLANEDCLTGLKTRRQGDKLFAAAFESAAQTGSPLSVILTDADNFKSINDRFSHIVGDSVLRQLSAICRQNCRSTDIAVRYGGEEILFVLPETDLDGAVRWAERLRVAVESFTWETVSPNLAVTLSLGVCSRSPQIASIDTDTIAFEVDAMVNAADAHLYAAKAAGRNCVRY